MYGMKETILISKFISDTSKFVKSLKNHSHKGHDIHVATMLDVLGMFSLLKIYRQSVGKSNSSN